MAVLVVGIAGCHVRPAQQVGPYLLGHTPFQVVVIGHRGCDRFIHLKEKMATSLQSKDRNQEAACIFIVKLNPQSKVEPSRCNLHSSPEKHGWNGRADI